MTPPRLQTLARAGAVVGLVYLATILGRNPVKVFVFAAPDGCREATVATVASWFWISALLLVVSLWLSRADRISWAAGTAMVGLASLAAMEGAAIRTSRDLKRQATTIHRMRDYASAVVLYSQKARELPATPTVFPTFPDSGIEPMDEWRHQFVYQRVSPTVALIAAPGSDGVITRPMTDDTSIRWFPHGSPGEDLIIRIDLHGLQTVTFLTSPKSPLYEACVLPSLLGCLCVNDD